MQLAALISSVRETLNDEDAANYRYLTSRLVEFANKALYEIAILRPELFAVTGDITCTAGTTLQSAPAASIVLLDLYQVKTGRVVTETTRSELDRFNANWHNETAAPAENWARDPKNPNRFLISPKAPVGQTLIGEWAESPAAMADETATFPLPDAYRAPVENYMIFRAEMKDDDYAVGGRGKAFYDAFGALIAATAQGKAAAETK